MEEDLKKRVSALYTIIKEQRLGNDAGSVLRRVEIIQELSKIIRADFLNTKDFESKVLDFLAYGSNSPKTRKK